MSVLWTDPLVSGIAAAVLAAVLGFVTIPVILSYAWRKMLLDKPDERKLHKTPTPRLAGLVFLPIIFLCVLAACLFTGTTSFGKEEFSLLAAAVLIYLVEYIDDLHTLSWKIKFLVQGLAAGAITFSGLWLRDLGGLLGIHALPAIAGIPLTIVLIVLITNALNLIDGLDGQAGGICFIA
ncbi:MAG: MraY family glycosyltransferase, partial [Bacteroidales bacterium]|nr:MraY family glycosyltransferase [Bacteroidales bacterium]